MTALSRQTDRDDSHIVASGGLNDKWWGLAMLLLMYCC